MNGTFHKYILHIRCLQFKTKSRVILGIDVWGYMDKIECWLFWIILQFLFNNYVTDLGNSIFNVWSNLFIKSSLHKVGKVRKAFRWFDFLNFTEFAIDNCMTVLLVYRLVVYYMIMIHLIFLITTMMTRPPSEFQI